MLHILEPGPLILDPLWLPGDPLEPRPDQLRDVLDLAEVELPRWSSLMRSIDGPTAASLVHSRWARFWLEGARAFAIGSPSQIFSVRIAKGNPGPAGAENLAEEATEKTYKFTVPAEERKMSNEAAFEWVEVKHKEEYKFLVVKVGGEFYGYAELTAPVAVEIGDTVRVNKETFVAEIP